MILILNTLKTYQFKQYFFYLKLTYMFHFFLLKKNLIIGGATIAYKQNMKTPIITG